MNFEGQVPRLNLHHVDAPTVAPVRHTIPKQLVPTPLIRKTSRPEIVSETRGPSRFPLFLILWVFGGFWLRTRWQKLTRRYDADASAIELRKLFERMGGLWIKVGQLLAMRNDVFSDAICREMSHLQSRAVGFPFDKVRESVEGDLGKPIEEVFSSFEPTPFAAASISQIHMATLRSKEGRVCVKVLRPEAEQSFMRDLAGVKRLFRTLAILGMAKHLHLDEALYELEKMVEEELDFRYEAANTRLMRKTLKKHSIHVPRVHRKVSGKHTLVSEFVDGVLMTDFINMGQNDPEALKDWCAENNVKQKKVARTLFYSAMRQLFEDNLFHADIHPGNILLLRDSKIVLLDFGTIGRSTKSFLTTYEASLRALAERDFVKAADMTLQLTISPPRIDKIKQLRAQLARSYREWDAVSHLDDVPYHERSLASAGGASGKIMNHYQVQLTWDFMRISRTWATLDASISHLWPGAKYLDMFRVYFADASARQRKLKVLLPKAARVVNGVTKAVHEYENLMGPAIRSRILYFSTAGQMSQRFALTLVAFLGIVKWMVYLSVFAGLVLLFDTLVKDIVSGEIEAMTTPLLQNLSFFDIFMALVVVVIVVFHVVRAIRRLDTRG